MQQREIIVPEAMKLIPERIGYAPGVKIGGFLFCSGQIGRTSDFEVVVDPEAQFVTAWENLKAVLHEGGCSFDDIVELTTYHVDIAVHLQLYKEVRDRYLPRAQSTWTAIGISALAHPALLLELKCIAIAPQVLERPGP